MLDKLKPIFWDSPEPSTGPYAYMFNFRRIWKWAVLLTAGVTLFPLIFITAIDFDYTRKSIESEILLRTSRVVSNAKRNISFFLSERKAALDFIVLDNSIEELRDPLVLAGILKNIREGFGGFEDLGVIDAKGRQVGYVGPHQLAGKDYSGQEWFGKIRQRGFHIGEVSLGFRGVPHLSMAVRRDLPDGSHYFLRATIDTRFFNEHLATLAMSGKSDAFIIDRGGVIQTPTRYHGKIFEKIDMTVPAYDPKTRVRKGFGPTGEELIVGYAYIPDSPFILMILKHKGDQMAYWHQTRMRLLWFLGFSVSIILVAIFGFATYLVNNMYLADKRRLMTLHEMEYSSKLATIGRLAAGVAHEINNPLAIINEKAGLIKDLFTFGQRYKEDPKINGLVDSVLSSVQRCGTITKRLLGFARHMDPKMASVKLVEVIHEVLGFFGKEAEYRSIAVTVSARETLPEFLSDRGKLQQILLNIINNAFAAMADGGRLDISTGLKDAETVAVTIADNGCGMSEAALKQLYEPFFTTRTEVGGTGLGMSITYSLVKEIGGAIHVTSAVAEGTTFTITLPLKNKQDSDDENTTG